MTKPEPEPPAWGTSSTPPPPPLPPMYQQVTGDQTHLGALWSMILGIAGLAAGVLALPTSGITAPGLVCSPIAFGLGLWASRATAARPDLYGNRGMAVAGWIMGLIGMLLALVSLLVIAAFIGLLIWLFASVDS